MTVDMRNNRSVRQERNGSHYRMNELINRSLKGVTGVGSMEPSLLTKLVLLFVRSLVLVMDSIVVR